MADFKKQGGGNMKPSKKFNVETSRTEVRYSKVVMLFAALCMCGIFVSCGSEDDIIPAVVSGDPANTDQNDTPVESPWHNLLNSKSYSGYVAIMFKDGTDIRLQKAAIQGPAKSFKSASREWPVEFVSRSNADVTKLNESIAARENVAVERGVPDITEEDIVLARENAAKAGVELNDWNLYYTISAPEPNEAESLIEELRKNPNVRFVHPIPIPQPLGDLTTPDISGGQSYLESYETHGGLNVVAGWEENATGEGVAIVDEEINWNYDHEDISINGDPNCVNSMTGCLDKPNEDKLYVPDSQLPPEYNSSKYVQHGTAVVGILTGLDNGGGIKGIAPNAKTKLFMVSDVTNVWDPIANLLKNVIGSWTEKDGSEQKLKPGDVILIEIGLPGPTTLDGDCTVADATLVSSGCVPMEAYPNSFIAIKNAVASGFIIVEGAGNSGLDLSSDDAHISDGPDLATETTNAIMVGASQGLNNNKWPLSNCGVRVDVYGWGTSVVTAGYGDYGLTSKLEVRAKDDDNNVACFDAQNVQGYDAATGQITDNTLLKQYLWENYPQFQIEGLKVTYKIVGICPDGSFSYDSNPATPQLDVSDPNKWYTSRFGGTSAATAMVGGAVAQIQSFVKKFYAGSYYSMDGIYFTAPEMKELLQSTGMPANGDDSCNIGLQPDVGAAIAKIKNFESIPAHKNIVPKDNTVVSGIRYDMDNDSRAELISFSRDGKWYIDLSSVGPNADHFGEWDLVIPSPLGGEGQGEGVMLFPVVHDYSSDGRADLALYDSINGKYYIKYTTSTLILSLSKDESIQWDRIIDYSTDPAWKPYSRPLPGDINNDHWLDISFQTPDGYWLIDYGGTDGFTIENNAIIYHDKFGEIDKSDIQYLSAAQLNAAPGWAWFSALGSNTDKYLLAKTPDGIAKPNYLYYTYINADGTYGTQEISKYVAMFGNNDSYLIIAGFLDSNELAQYSFKYPDGSWSYLDGINWKFKPLISPEPQGYGDLLCRPIPADYDGDGKDDRAVQCGTSWKIAYSTQPDVFKTVDLDSAINPLPAYVYPGGIKYIDQISLFTYYKTKLTCSDGEKCGMADTIFDVAPPIGPYFAECVKYWAPNANYCWDK